MRVPLNWLHEYVTPDLDAAALADRLALTGTEVERVERYGVTALERFVVGRVRSVERHPQADRLSLCRVEIGESDQAQIVCGAANVEPGQTVAVAKPGAVLPDGTILTKATLRGVESNGMILAEDELGIGTEHAGIIVLDEDGLSPGTPLVDVLPIATDVLVLEITPNRPDCLGIYGVAREVHAATSAPLAPAPWTEDPGGPGEAEGASVSVEDPELCPRFIARVFEDVEIKPSPPWLKARLMAAGQRPISNVVDITNYVMLLTGHPVHAFDLDRVAGGHLTVRRAKPGESVETLDGQTRALTEDMVLIADDEGPTSIAGVMGGARSEVSVDTTRVLMEVANWNGANIHRTSLALGLRSEASTRFEKQLQPEQAMEAQAVATQLMLALTSARLLPGTIDVGGAGPSSVTIRLRDARIEELLGTRIPRRRSKEILEALEFETREAPDGLDVTVPPFRRGDVAREADLIEEVARINGLEELPATIPSRHGASGRLTRAQRFRRRAADALAAQRLYEVVGWSFASAELQARLGISTPAVELANPMSSVQSQLRTTLLGSLLDAARHNLAHGASTVRLFESGAVYVPRSGKRSLPDEPYHVGGLMIGAVRLATWREPEPPQVDFFAAKGVLAGVLDTLRVPWSVTAANEPFLHPGRAAVIEAGEERIGWLGEIHPTVAGQWDIDQPVAAFELDLDRALAASTELTTYEDLTSFPSVREDLAVIVAESVSAAEVVEVVRGAGSPLLREVEVFDVYRDEQRLGAGNVSLALRLTYRAPDRTLTDAEVASVRSSISAALADQLSGRVRDA